MEPESDRFQICLRLHFKRPASQHYLFDWFPPMLLFTTPLFLCVRMCCCPTTASWRCGTLVVLGRWSDGWPARAYRWLSNTAPSVHLYQEPRWVPLDRFAVLLWHKNSCTVLCHKISTYESYASRSFSRRDSEDGSFLQFFGSGFIWIRIRNSVFLRYLVCYYLIIIRHLKTDLKKAHLCLSKLTPSYSLPSCQGSVLWSMSNPKCTEYRYLFLPSICVNIVIILLKL